MTERRIPFTDPMILALLDLKKWETRRVIKPQPEMRQNGWHWKFCISGVEDVDLARLLTTVYRPYGQVGDRLLATETWRIYAFWKEEQRFRILYKVDGSRSDWISIPEPERFWRLMRAYDKAHTRWRPARFMPKEFSRITRTIAYLRAERLQDITEEGAIAEGITVKAVAAPGRFFPSDFRSGTFRYGFAQTWDFLNAKRGYPYSSNPWVRAIGMKLVEERL